MIFILPITKRRILNWERKSQTLKLLSALQKVKFNKRILIILSLAKLEDKTAIPALTKLLNDRDNIIRKEAGNTLLKIDTSVKIKKLVDERKEHWEKIKSDRTKKKDDIEFDKNLHSFKGRFKGNITRTKEVKEKLKRPIRWG